MPQTVSGKLQFRYHYNQSAADLIRYSHLFLTRTYGIDPAFLKQVFHIANTTLQTFANTPGLLYTLVFQPLPSVITSHGAANADSPNALGLDPDAGCQVLALQSIQWADANDDGIINEAARSIWMQADELAMRMGLQRKWIYMNYANQDQDPIGSYGSQNVAKLQATSKKYDPTGLFQTNVPGGFKLFNKAAAGSNCDNGVANTMSWKDLKSHANVRSCHCRHRTERNKDAI